MWLFLIYSLSLIECATRPSHKLGCQPRKSERTDGKDHVRAVSTASSGSEKAYLGVLCDPSSAIVLPPVLPGCISTCVSGRHLWKFYSGRYVPGFVGFAFGFSSAVAGFDFSFDELDWDESCPGILHDCLANLLNSCPK